MDTDTYVSNNRTVYTLDNSHSLRADSANLIQVIEGDLGCLFRTRGLGFNSLFKDGVSDFNSGGFFDKAAHVNHETFLSRRRVTIGWVLIRGFLFEGQVTPKALRSRISRALSAMFISC